MVHGHTKAVEARPNLSRLRVLLLEPDAWRYRGLRGELEKRDCEVVGDISAERTLRGDRTFQSLDVVLVAESLIADGGSRFFDRLKRFGATSILVHGDAADDRRAAELIREGASGFFILEMNPDQLVEALRIVSRKRLWGSREAVALVARAPSSTLPQQRPFSVVADESHIFRLLGRGLTNKEIGQKLGVAEVTVKSRLTKLYRKFGVSSRLQLLSAAIRDGIVKQFGSEADRLKRH